MHTLYPAIKPYATHRLRVDALHELYLEECGAPEGIPVLFVHGGPGVGCSERDRRFFDPERYRIILFDQRGCNRSRPHAELQANTTWELVADMEAIRQFLGLERWLLFGGSWGATLALAYAQQHPGSVMGMILRGVFLGREEDFHWLYRQGANRIFPDHWHEFIELIPEGERDDLLAAYHRRLFGGDELARMNAARHWSAWEGGIATLRPSQKVIAHFADPHLALALSRIKCHYFTHLAWLADKPILSRINRLTRIPAIIIHGRYDMVCPLDNATVLAGHWPTAELQVIRDAGHTAMEPGIIDALVRAADQFAGRFEKS